MGRFDLSDIPTAPRGVPQIEVNFDIDANGILNVSAKDKATGKEQSIVIKASSGLNDAEIDRMVKDAEAHAEEDRKLRELVDVRNQAENLVHSAEKSVKELGEKVTDDEKTQVEKAISELREAMKGEDKEAIERKSEALAEVSGKLATRVYEQQAQDAGGAADSDAAPETADSGAGADDVVDAEFEEVKDDNK